MGNPHQLIRQMPWLRSRGVSSSRGGGGGGAQQAAALSNIDVRNFAQRHHFGFGEESAQMSLDRRVEEVLLLFTNHTQYVVDGNKAFGQAPLSRTNKPVQRSREAPQGVRTF